MVDPSGLPSAARGAPGGVGAAAIAQYIEHREFGPKRRLPSEPERQLIQDAIEGFVCYEQWLPLEQGQLELIARLRAAVDDAVGNTADEQALLGQAADALTELGQRLALQRHAREIMQEELVLQGGALHQADVAAGREAKQAKIPAAAGQSHENKPVQAAAVDFR